MKPSRSGYSRFSCGLATISHSIALVVVSPGWVRARARIRFRVRVSHATATLGMGIGIGVGIGPRIGLGFGLPLAEVNSFLESDLLQWSASRAALVGI